jgi:hypothetical protein
MKVREERKKTLSKTRLRIIAENEQDEKSYEDKKGRGEGKGKGYDTTRDR